MIYVGGALFIALVLVLQVIGHRRDMRNLRMDEAQSRRRAKLLDEVFAALPTPSTPANGYKTHGPFDEA